MLNRLAKFRDRVFGRGDYDDEYISMLSDALDKCMGDYDDLLEGFVKVTDERRELKANVVKLQDDIDHKYNAVVRAEQTVTALRNDLNESYEVHKQYENEQTRLKDENTKLRADNTRVCEFRREVIAQVRRLHKITHPRDYE